MAPEQVNIRAFSPAYDPCKADMWALAIMFWELKFRKRPWEQASYGARDRFEIFLRGSYNFLANEPDLGQDAFFLLLGLLRLNPKERLSAQEVVRRLEKIAQSN
ncbi:hypothetical protein DFQ26_005130 [Actinomortierella ambigua]|nr:hypothetical protein DFQ26_005130 [Actinomortierella ambigua]